MATKHDDSCLKKAGESEPIFVLRAQDRSAPEVVQYWAELAEDAGAPRDKVEEARELAEVMINWQRQHGCKVPD